MGFPLITVLIPVYNGSNFLGEAIDSALAQSYANTEILVVNDGSRDNGATEAIALRYGERIRYIAKPNGGVASALNMGLEHMRGDFVAWLSHDDVMLPDRLTTQMTFWQQLDDPRCIVYGDVDVIDAAGRRTAGPSLPDLTPNDTYWRIWGQSWLNGCAMLIPKALLVELGGFRLDLPTTQDYDLWLRLARTARFCHQHHTVLLSRVHGEQGSTTKSHRVECANLFFNHLPELLDWCTQRVPERERSAVLAWCLLQRGADYGWPLLRKVMPFLWRHLQAAERLRLLRHVLSGVPKALLRSLWVRLPSVTRHRLRQMQKQSLCGKTQRHPSLLHKTKQALQHGGPGAVRDRACRYIKKVIRQRWQLVCAQPVSGWTHAAEKPLCLILDHDSGGGTQAFRQQAVAKRLESGTDVLVWQYLVQADWYLFELNTAEGQRLFKTSSLHEAQAFVESIGPSTVLVNNLVGWAHPDAILSGLRSLQASGVRIELFLHDYFPVCPVYVLLNRQERFCGIPADLGICERCLPGHPLSPPHASYDIEAWRHMWSLFFAEVDALHVADASVRDLYARAYPDLTGRMELRPHAPLQNWPPLVIPEKERPGVIGVLGTITRHKGATLVEDLVHLLEQQQVPLRVVVVGSLESSTRSPLLTVTGAYNHEELPALFHRYGITVGLVPSICPETFCYAAQEVEMLGLPLVCLDIGAQGARARRYALGRVASTPDAKGCLEAILEVEQQRMSTGFSSLP